MMWWLIQKKTYLVISWGHIMRVDFFHFCYCLVPHILKFSPSSDITSIQSFSIRGINWFWWGTSIFWIRFKMFEQKFLQIIWIKWIDEMRNKQFLECPNHLSATGDLFLQFLIVSCISFAAPVWDLNINHIVDTITNKKLIYQLAYWSKSLEFRLFRNSIYFFLVSFSLHDSILVSFDHQAGPMPIQAISMLGSRPFLAV